MPGASCYLCASQQGSEYPPYYPAYHRSSSVLEQHQPFASHPSHRNKILRLPPKLPPPALTQSMRGSSERYTKPSALSSRCCQGKSVASIAFERKGNFRRFRREFIALVQNAGYSLPPSWGQADLWLQELFYSVLRRKPTLFQVCHNNSKGYTLMNQAFHEGFVRKTADDMTDSMLLDSATQSVLSKRVVGEDVVDEYPAKRACTMANMLSNLGADRHISRATTGTTHSIFIQHRAGIGSVLLFPL
ncbi:hypothetical protein LXA43DRAFT_1097871 [Ganoderma leucocontextum]|nr:hypothetical protein LXA43DRAFT_1097871 [Ganoderma leucocontextum]